MTMGTLDFHIAIFCNVARGEASPATRRIPDCFSAIGHLHLREGNTFGGRVRGTFAVNNASPGPCVGSCGRMVRACGVRRVEEFLNG